MPTETILVLAGVIGAFGIFALVLAYVDITTNAGRKGWE